MLFTSQLYLFVFLPAVLAGYLVLRRTRVSNLFLSAASLVFYGFLQAWYCIPLLLSATLDFFIGRRLGEEADERKAKRLVTISVAVNLGLLALFKYTGWLSGELAAALGFAAIAYAPPLPPGISFYTFQTLSYSLDIRRGKTTPTHSFADFLAFVSFFPQLVAGPIERAANLLPKLSAERPLVTAAAASSAVTDIVYGLFLKLVIADNLGAIVDLIAERAGPTTAPGAGVLLAYAFAFQIYCDFAAYSTIARGSARLFGIELSRNFLTPYLSASPSEFWSRWHISLSTFLRDYLYIPLGGSEGGRAKTARNLLITMALAGLWHGAGLFFIAWGLWHAVLLVLYHFLPLDRMLARLPAGRAIAVIVFFHLVCVGWLFFRLTPDQLAGLWPTIAGLPAALLCPDRCILTPENGLMGYLLTGFAAFALPVVIFDILARTRDVEFGDIIDAMPHWLRAIVMVALFYAIVLIGRRDADAFIYFQF